MADSSSSSASAKKIVLKTSDGETFEVDEAVALQSQTIRHLIEDGYADDGIPLPNVTSKVFTRVLEYCTKHAQHPKKPVDQVAVTDCQKRHVPVNDVYDRELRAWDEEFVKADFQPLFRLILAANYLSIESLMNLTCQAVADKIKNKSPEYVRKVFRITNDFSPEEEEKLRAETAWAYEGVDED